jgi:hypothetical protein
MALSSRQIQARRQQTQQIQQLAAQGKPLPANLANSQSVKVYAQAAAKASGAAYNPRSGMYVGAKPVPIQTESGRVVQSASSGPRGKDPVKAQLEMIAWQENRARVEAEQIRPFQELGAAQEALRVQQEAYQRQLEEQQRVQAQAQAELTKAERQAQIAGKRSAATSSRLRSQAMIEQSQLQQAAARTGQAIQGQQRKQPGTTVGQPGRTRTRVASGLGIGGYGGTRAARVSPTGLNI